MLGDLQMRMLHVNAIKTQVILFGSRHALSKNTTIVLPSLGNITVVWSGCTETAAKKLEVVQNNVARAINHEQPH